jgi:hypothetical protein
MSSRPLTPAECALATTVFGPALRLDAVRIHRAKWWPFQPREVAMAPRGAIHFHPRARGYHACFAHADLAAQAWLVHELVHVWQHQLGRNLILARIANPRYRYRLTAARAFADYGIEQQAQIVTHAFVLRHGGTVPGAPPLARLEALIPFGPA